MEKLQCLWCTERSLPFFSFNFIFYVRISNKCYSEMYGKHEYLNFK